MNAHFPLLKRSAQLGVVLSLLNLPAVAQELPLPVPPRPTVPREVSSGPIVVAPPPPSRFSEPSTPALARFNLSFPGGTLEEFVVAVSKARGTPVNVVVSPENSQTRIPPLEMHQVDVPSLFDAVTRASIKREKIVRSMNGKNNYIENVERGFMLSTVGNGTSDVWYFSLIGPPFESDPLDALPDKQVRFYNLEPYLTNHTIDDITTVLSAGNELRTGGKDRLNLKFHKETKLLIVRGTVEELAMVEDALKQLRPAATPQVPTPAMAK